ncbi:MAG: class B sortase [Clostridia bacterium]|nr:class B sortase [Clostridia bacterium]
MNLSDKLKSLKSALTEKPEETGDFEGELTFENQEHGFENGTFLNSLDELSENDIELNAAAEQAAKMSLTEIMRRSVYYGCFAVFIVSCLLLVQNLIAKQKGVEIYDRLEQEFFSTGFSMDLSNAFRPDEGVVKYLSAGTESPTLNDMTSIRNGMEAQNPAESAALPEEEEYNEELEKMRAGLMSLARINPDVYGWITVDGTNINYPLVQGEDNDYYLNHAYTGDYLPIGSIFVDFRCEDSITRNFNTVIYGHNITTGTMFHDVTKFFRDDYFNDTYIYIYTLDGIYVYEPFSIYKTREDYNYFRTGFTSVEDFVGFAEELCGNSDKEKEISFDKNSRIITLSTCTNIVQSERYALHAKLVKTILD